MILQVAPEEGFVFAVVAHHWLLGAHILVVNLGLEHNVLVTKVARDDSPWTFGGHVVGQRLDGDPLTALEGTVD